MILQSGAGAGSAAAVAAGASGTVTVRSQAGGANTGGATGQVGGAGGALTVQAGAGGATNSTGAHASGAGGAVNITSGAGGASTGVTATAAAGGGDVALTAGDGGAQSNGTGNGGNGGSIILTPGAGGTSAGGTAGTAGSIHLRSSVGAVFRQQTVALDIVDTAPTLTVAQFINGIVFGQPTTGRAVTTPTGAQISAAITDLAVGDSFDFTLIVDGSVGADDIYTLTAGDGNVTFKGVATLGPIVTNTAPGCATWIFRNTGANTWVGYRRS